MLRKDITGKTIGRWTVLGYKGRVNGIQLFECRCQCGTVKLVRATNLRSGKTKSCGCLQREIRGEMSRDKGNKNRRHTIVRCLDTGKVYNSVTEASEDTGIRVSYISKVCMGESKSAHGTHWEYVEKG